MWGLVGPRLASSFGQPGHQSPHPCRLWPCTCRTSSTAVWASPLDTGPRTPPLRLAWLRVLPPTPVQCCQAPCRLLPTRTWLLAGLSPLPISLPLPDAPWAHGPRLLRVTSSHPDSGLRFLTPSLGLPPGHTVLPAVLPTHMAIPGESSRQSCPPSPPTSFPPAHLKVLFPAYGPAAGLGGDLTPPGPLLASPGHTAASLALESTRVLSPPAPSPPVLSPPSPSPPVLSPPAPSPHLHHPPTCPDSGEPVR